MFQRILLAIDSGDAAAVASCFTVALARSGAASVHVVHVNERFIGGFGLTTEEPDEGADVVTEVSRDMRAAGIPVTGATYATTPFDVAPAIADVAEQWRADVIVVGSRRRRVGPVLRASMRDKIARTTPLPVLTAPAPLRVGRRARAPQVTPTPLDSRIH
jgi:nucleotide-binding universal stress UspA family protein